MKRLLRALAYSDGGAGRWWGQLSRDHPKQGPNSQLEGLRRRHVAPTDQILQIAQGGQPVRWQMGRGISLQPLRNPLPPPPHTYITPQAPHPQAPHPSSHSMSSLSLYLTVLASLLGLASPHSGSQAMFKKLCFPRWALNLNSCQDFVDPSPLTGAITDCSCFLDFFAPVKIINSNDGYCM